jgi:putative heme iron utilization protein
MGASSPGSNRWATARTARLLVRRSDRAALATLLSGAPYASLVLLGADLDGSPLLLLSDLAQATRNLKAEPRASLLVCAAESARDPLDSPRLTLIGRIEPTSDPRHRRRYLARQPQSALYADLGDFRFYRMALERAHYVGGFGKIAWFEARELLTADLTQGLAEAEAALLEWMNREQRVELDLCANRLAGRSGAGWQATGIDPDGIDLRRAGDSDFARLDFAAPAPTDHAFRSAFSALLAAAHSDRKN